MDITLNDAYREACTALGEAIVQQRLLAAQLQQAQQDAPDAPAAP